MARDLFPINEVCMNITLRKALNLKNKLVGEISTLGNEIIHHNQYDAGRNSISEKIDVQNKLLEYTKKKSDLIELKTAIVNANAGAKGDKSIYSTLVKIEEAKSLISFLRSIPTDTTTRENTDYRTNTVTYAEVNVQVSYEEIQKHIKTAELSLEKLLDTVEEFNGNTKIEVSF